MSVNYATDSDAPAADAAEAGLLFASGSRIMMSGTSSVFVIVARYLVGSLMMFVGVASYLYSSSIDDFQANVGNV